MTMSFGMGLYACPTYVLTPHYQLMISVGLQYCMYFQLSNSYFCFQLNDNEEKKDGETDNVVYADLDKSALGSGKNFEKCFEILY